MTRVWRAVQILDFGGEVESGKEVALKDVWLDRGALTEGSNQRAIFDAVDSERQKHARGEKSRLDFLQSLHSSIKDDVLGVIRDGTYRNYFLKIKFGGQGAVTREKLSDAEPKLGSLIPMHRDIDSRSHQSPGPDPSRNKGTPVQPPESEFEPSTEPKAHQNQHYIPKQRYLLIFDDICTVLHNAPDLQTTFAALRHAWIGKCGPKLTFTY